MVSRVWPRLGSRLFASIRHRGDPGSWRTASRVIKKLGRISLMSSPFFMKDTGFEENEESPLSRQDSAMRGPSRGWPLRNALLRPGLMTIYMLSEVMTMNAHQFDRHSGDTEEAHKTDTSSGMDNENLFEDLSGLLPRHQRHASYSESKEGLPVSPSAVSTPIPINRNPSSSCRGSPPVSYSPDLSFSPEDTECADLESHPAMDDSDFSILASKVDLEGRLVLQDEDIVGERGWKSLGFFLAACPSVRTLRLQGMEISKTKAMQLGQGGLKHIRSITLHGNNLGFNEDALEIIVGMLLLSDYLEDAQINRNCISDKHLEVILRLLDKHSLKNLSLAWNGITDNGARSIADKLRDLDSRRSSLTHLDLSHNRIDKRGLRELRSSQLHQLKQHKTFCLNWQRNKFSPPSSWTVGSNSPYTKHVTPPRSPHTSTSGSPPMSNFVLPPSLASKQYSPPTRTGFATPLHAYNPSWGGHNLSPTITPVGSPPTRPTTPTLEKGELQYRGGSVIVRFHPAAGCRCILQWHRRSSPALRS
eukprot:g27136.t1